MRTENWTRFIADRRHMAFVTCMVSNSNATSGAVATTGVTSEELLKAIRTTLVTPYDSRAWSIQHRPEVGRCLVAARNIEAEEIVFCERPLVVAQASSTEADRAMRGEMAAVAFEMLQLPPSHAARLLCEPDFAADSDGQCAGSLRTWVLGTLRALRRRGEPHTRSDDERTVVAITEERVEWALGTASVNVHGAPGPPARGVLALLGSMMEHACDPSCYTDIGPSDDGSLLTLRTRRAVRKGEPLSITYVDQSLPVDARREQLRKQHCFVCYCERCVRESVTAVGGTAAGVPGELL